MTHILALHSSLSSERSISSRLINQTVAALRQSAPNAEVTVRDLAASPVPHLDGEALSGIRGNAVTEAQIAARALANQLIGELRAADALVIGAPMYNFGIPSSLRAWFDYVLHPGVTFQYGEGGPKGLVTGKRAIVILSRGGFYSDGPAKAYDSQEPHLRALLGSRDRDGPDRAGRRGVQGGGLSRAREGKPWGCWLKACGATAGMTPPRPAAPSSVPRPNSAPPFRRKGRSGPSRGVTISMRPGPVPGRIAR